MQVVTREGQPVDGLTATARPATPPGAPVPAAPEAAGAPGEPRRLYILAVDEISFSTLALLAWKEAIKRFIQGLEPTDFVGLYAYPMGGSLVQLTQDHASVLRAADRVVGRFEPPYGAPGGVVPRIPSP